jgi:hypothetical protein
VVICSDPIAEAGGPYVGDEGSNIELDGSASTDSDGTIVLYSWDLDGDGQYDDASGATVNFNTTIDGVHTVALRVTDNFGANSLTDTADVTVNNVAPTADAGGPYSVIYARCGSHPKRHRDEFRLSGYRR